MEEDLGVLVEETLADCGETIGESSTVSKGEPKMHIVRGHHDDGVARKKFKPSIKQQSPPLDNYLPREKRKNVGPLVGISNNIRDSTDDESFQSASSSSPAWSCKFQPTRENIKGATCLSAASTAPSLQGDDEKNDKLEFNEAVLSREISAFWKGSSKNSFRKKVKQVPPRVNDLLPVWTQHRRIAKSITENQVTVVVGETGSGKTTQIPQMLLVHFNNEKVKVEKGGGRNLKPRGPSVIGITQPRRVAAISLATRVLAELRQRMGIEGEQSKLEINQWGLEPCRDDLTISKHSSRNHTLRVIQHGKTSKQGVQSLKNCEHSSNENRISSSHSSLKDPLSELGGLVGFSVRFHSRTSSQTQIKFLTDGMILREAMVDPLLSRYRVIIVDEAHERTLRTDILLGILKTLLEHRPSLRIVIMSATLDYHAFTTFFGQGEVILVPGRQYPVVVYNTIRSQEEYMESLVSTIIQLHLTKEGPGDILAFLPGQDEIEHVKYILNDKANQLRNIRSDFYQWQGVILTLKEKLHDPRSWQAFLDGNWEARVSQIAQSEKADSGPNHSSKEREKVSLSDYEKAVEEICILLSSFSQEELEIVKNLRKCLSALNDKITIQESDTTESSKEALLSSCSNSSQSLPRVWRDQCCSMMMSFSNLGCLVLESLGNFLINGVSQAAGIIGRSATQVALPTDLVNSNGTTQAEIQSVNVEQLSDLSVVPFYAAIPIDQQQVVFQATPPQTRKVILATNIAETSLTIPGVRYVVDCGLHKMKAYNPRSGVETLTTRTISRAMANQRSGRAGREGVGECYRLYTEQDYFSMDIQADPEIKRCNLTQTVLELKTLGMNNISLFPFISKPNATSLEKALQLLKSIGALDQQERITEVGNKLAAIPVDPEFGKFLLDSAELGCTAEALTIVAVLNSDPIFISVPRTSEVSLPSLLKAISSTPLKDAPILSKQQSPRASIELSRQKVLCVLGDHLSILNAYRMWEKTPAKDRSAFCKTFGLNHRALQKARNIRNQLKDVLLSNQIGFPSISSCLIVESSANSGHNNHQGVDIVRRCLVKSFPNRIAILDSNDTGTSSTGVSPSKADYCTARYVIEATRTPVSLHPSCILFGRPNKPRYVIFTELIETSKLYIRNVTGIENEWLTEFHPNLFKQLHLQQLHTNRFCLTRNHHQLPNSTSHHKSTLSYRQKKSAAMQAMRTGKVFLGS